MPGLRDWFKKNKKAKDKRFKPDAVVDPTPQQRFDNPERDIITDPGPWTDRKRKFWRI